MPVSESATGTGVARAGAGAKERPMSEVRMERQWKHCRGA
jgi:hypothetical protein